jgi:endonuclease YncB( thermonuclease family)
MAFSVARSSAPFANRRCVRQPRAGTCTVRATNDNAQLDQREYPRLFDELTDTVDDVKRAPRSMVRVAFPSPPAVVHVIRGDTWPCPGLGRSYSFLHPHARVLDGELRWNW